MRVTSLIQRTDGHSVRFGNTAYAFTPPSYACDVTNEAHIERFRQIPEGYEVEAPKPRAKASKPVKPTADRDYDLAG